MNKQQLAQKLADAAGTDRKVALGVLDALGPVVIAELNSTGLVVLPGIGRIKLVVKPATPAGTGINPFTKEPMAVKAKPARRTLKAVLGKPLKEAVENPNPAPAT